MQLQLDKDLCDDAVDRIQQAFRELWPSKALQMDAPKLPSSGSFRLPFPVPSASINGRILSGLDLLERTLEQEIQREMEMISFSFMQFRRRADQLPLQQITNFAYGPKQLHPMFLQMEPKLLTAWYPGISAVSPRHVPLRPEHLAALPRWMLPAGPPVLYLVLLGAKDPVKLMQDRIWCFILRS
ncbi:unnamed protein product [Cladocopium goreaui]|uniref:UDP-glucose:glycoprotein glucosyltransferase A n=1 Tax=Cladocopium goreaui TaxID=2562237 RepID=A0A9P1CUG2_9DINO|nr:unnamed protein product [Cladocopium goreaui]